MSAIGKLDTNRHGTEWCGVKGWLGPLSVQFEALGPSGAEAGIKLCDFCCDLQPFMV